MSSLSPDTSPEAREVQRAIWRRMGPQRRLLLAMQMSDDSRRIAADGIRHRHPEYSEAEVGLALSRLLLGDPLFAAAFPAAPLFAP